MRRTLIGLWIAWLLVFSSSTYASFDTSRDWFEALTLDERKALQSDLTLIGLYTGVIDGILNEDTYQALVAFEKDQGDVVDGAIDTGDRARLRTRAEEIYDTFGFALTEDWPAALKFKLPKALMPTRSASLRSSAYLSPSGEFEIKTEWRSYAEASFVELYVGFTDPSAGRTVEFADYSSAQFIVSGTLNGKNYYRVFVSGPQGSSGLTFTWSPSASDVALVAAHYMASTLTALKRWEPPDQPVEPRPYLPKLPSTEGLTPVRLGTFVIFEGNEEVIALESEMTDVSPLDFRRALRARPNARVVLLNSPGGPVDSALILAGDIHERGLATYVPAESTCVSTCSIVFLSGTIRLASGVLGTHQLEDEDSVSVQAKLADVLEAFRDFGVAREIEQIMLRTPPADMHVFSPAEIDALVINRGDLSDPRG